MIADYEALFERAILDPALKARANKLWEEISPSIFTRNSDRAGGTLRASDSGRCTLELYAELHGALDIPDNWKSVLLKMEQGSMSGARQACYIAAAAEADGYRVELEVELEDDGIPGHADVVLYEGDLCIEVIECKWSASMRPVEALEDREYHAIQAAKYAMGKGAPLFTVIETTPAARGGIISCFREDTADWMMRVDAEYQRLSGALADVAPEPSVVQDFSCTYCRFSACGRNRNPLRKKTVSV